MHAVFRIVEIKPIKNSDDRFWKVEVKLTSGNNRQLDAAIDPMREKTLIRSNVAYLSIRKCL